ncbi:hypothetical protein SAMN05660706_12716 [Desulfoscipio geothermicus DSM 3669]|uniref:Transposase n=1 Tax=Desulfoscipio geothermicus DSM 3669 TaxID=1121426 RepID=A0A1I6E6V9_9FIRM|nr:hypothetical protein SAMN05660706_12716 [Desulfoscipio geothermicus DSM 3669]
MLSGVKKISEVASEYKVHPAQLHRWKAEAIENLHSLFTSGANEIEKIRKQYYAEKKELTKQIDQLTLEVNWLKKKSAELNHRRRKTLSTYTPIQLKISTECWLNALMGGRWAMIDYNTDTQELANASTVNLDDVSYNSSYE